MGTFVENAIRDMCQNSEKSINVEEVGAPASIIWDSKLHDY